nr:hypothetical protein CFP56_77093 [Quercus suber]
MEHTCSISYRNPRCTASYIGKKLVKRVRRQLNIKLKDIRDAVHEKYVVNISVGKASKAREKAQDAVDRAHTAQFNQLWEYCDELRRCSPGSTVLMKVHTFNDGDLATEHGLATAKATYQQAFERAMNELKEVDEDAFKWLQFHSTTIWARHMFTSDGQSDIVLNNMCKNFNSMLVKFRSKPIITMLECIRLYLMTRFQANREMIMKVESELCPKIRKRLYKEKLACSKWIACWAGQPINDQNMWRPSGLPLVQPPIKRRPPGRPKKKRALKPNEPRSHRKNRGLGISKQCKTCEKLGHNKRSCKGEVGGNSSLPWSASQASRTTRRAAKDSHANSLAVGSAQLAKDVTTSAPPPPTDNQSNPRPAR